MKQKERGFPLSLLQLSVLSIVCKLLFCFRLGFEYFSASIKSAFSASRVVHYHFSAVRTCGQLRAGQGPDPLRLSFMCTGVGYPAFRRRHSAFPSFSLCILIELYCKKLFKPRVLCFGSTRTFSRVQRLSARRTYAAAILGAEHPHRKSENQAFPDLF